MIPSVILPASAFSHANPGSGAATWHLVQSTWSPSTSDLFTDHDQARHLRLFPAPWWSASRLNPVTLLSLFSLARRPRPRPLCSDLDTLSPSVILTSFGHSPYIPVTRRLLRLLYDPDLVLASGSIPLAETENESPVSVPCEVSPRFIRPLHQHPFHSLDFFSLSTSPHRISPSIRIFSFISTLRAPKHRSR